MALSAVLVYIMLTAVALSPVRGQQQDSCAACNCPLDSDMDLDGFVTTRINEIMGNEPRKLLSEIANYCTQQNYSYLKRLNSIAELEREKG